VFWLLFDKPVVKLLVYVNTHMIDGDTCFLRN